MCILSPTFNPQKFGGLAKYFLNEYVKTNDPVPILSSYLNAFTKGRIEGKWNAAEFDNKQVSPWLESV